MMRHLLNTLFVTSQEIYLSLENENIVAWKGNQIVQRLPLLNLENILYFGHKGTASKNINNLGGPLVAQWVKNATRIH